jgi:hypothetical protein
MTAGERDGKRSPGIAWLLPLVFHLVQPAVAPYRGIKNRTELTEGRPAEEYYYMSCSVLVCLCEVWTCMFF